MGARASLRQRCGGERRGREDVMGEAPPVFLDVWEIKDFKQDYRLHKSPLRGYPFPKPPRKQRLRKGFMTIAAGFQFNGGVLICADRQYSGPSIKFFETKLSYLDTVEPGSDRRKESLHTVIAMTGTDGYMQTVCEQVQDAIHRAYDNTDADQRSAIVEREVIEQALAKAYKKHIYPHPHYGYTTGPVVELLIGIWKRGENATLYRTTETSANAVSFFDPFVFLGSGSDVARYAISPLVSPSMYSAAGLTLNECILLASHTLRVAKQNDIYCGGESEFAVLYDNGSTGGVAKSKIDAIEKYSETFEEILRRLFFAVADMESRFTATGIDFTNEQIELIRNEQAKLRTERDRLASLLSPKVL
jgi:20S proteasome alpha/beta subunit